MAETADYNPGPWAGHDFADARAAYDQYASRSYNDAVVSQKTTRDVAVGEVRTDCSRPLVIVSDVTGSMGEWPAVMFSKLPYLAKEAATYLGPDLEICFAATGDANGDNYPVQVRPFAKGLELADRLKELVIEGNGGGQRAETYELLALYFARKCTLREGAKPVLIFIADEHPYEQLYAEHASTYLGINLPGRGIMTSQVFEELQTRFAVYLVLKPYDTGGNDFASRENIRVWSQYLVGDHIKPLPDPNRIVDVIFGILAQETGMVDYFQEELTGRQKPDQVMTVLKALKLPAFAPQPGHTGRSVMLAPSKGAPRSRSLV